MYIVQHCIQYSILQVQCTTLCLTTPHHQACVTARLCLTTPHHQAHVTARLRAKERDLEHERQALEEAKAEFKRKQRELQNKSNELERVREEIKRPR